jgi:hypothetical protein
MLVESPGSSLSRKVQELKNSEIPRNKGRNRGFGMFMNGEGVNFHSKHKTKHYAMWYSQVWLIQKGKPLPTCAGTPKSADTYWWLLSRKALTPPFGRLKICP